MSIARGNSADASGGITIIPAVSGRVVEIKEIIFLSADAAVDVDIKDADGVALMPTIYLSAKGGMISNVGLGVRSITANKAITLTTDAAGNISYMIKYDYVG